MTRLQRIEVKRAQAWERYRREHRRVTLLWLCMWDALYHEEMFGLNASDGR